MTRDRDALGARRLVDPDWCAICGDAPQVEDTELCAACLGSELDDDNFDFDDDEAADDE